MNPFEIERLGWEEIRGLPLVGDPAISTGRFRIVCSREDEGAGLEETEAVGTPIEVGVGADEPNRSDRRSEQLPPRPRSLAARQSRMARGVAAGVHCSASEAGRAG